MFRENQIVRLVTVDRDHSILIEQYLEQSGKVVEVRDGIKFTTCVRFDDGFSGWFANEELEEIV